MNLSPLLLTTLLALPAMAQSPCATDAMVVFDGSASMSEITFDIQGDTRIEDARAAMARAAPDVQVFRRIGLITYGPGGADACSGISLRFPPIEQAAGALVAEVDALRPAGLTPLAASVAQAAEVLNHRLQSGIIVLVTDGNETCGGTPCALSRQLAAEAADLTIHVIGYKAAHDFFGWDNPEGGGPGSDVVAKCLADATGGRFVTTETVDELTAALQETLGCALVGRNSAVDKIVGLEPKPMTAVES